MSTQQNASATWWHRRKALRYAQLAAFALSAWLLWPSVGLAPSPLDDASQLHELAQAPLSRVLELDRFGHLRPLKSALFWLLSRHLDWLPVWRGVLLLLLLGSARLWQLLCVPLLKSDAWALAVALCWMLNPTTTSSLCWLSASSLVIAALGVLAYVWLLDRAHTIPAHVSLLAAVLSHELALLAPLLFVFYRRAREPAARDARRRLLIALVGMAICLALWLGLYAASPSRNIDYRFASYSRWLLVLNAPHYLFDNLRLWFWLPGRFGVLLAAAPAQELWPGALGWLLLAALCVLLWRVCARDATLRFAVLSAGIMLLPLTNFVPLGNTPVAVHYLYLPGFGLALLLVRAAQRMPGPRWLSAALILPLMAAWLPEQRRVLAAWTDAPTLYTATIDNYPDNIEARVNLSAIYLDAKKYNEADALLRDSLQRAPSEKGLVLNRFKLLVETGQVDEALAFYDAQPQLDVPNIAIVRGLLLLRVRRDAQASEAFGRALERAVQPDERLAAGQGLVLALVRMHEDARAQQVVDSLLAEFPDHPELRFLLVRRP